MKKNFVQMISIMLVVVLHTQSSVCKAVDTHNDPIKTFYVVVDAHGLMCPFLSPMVIQEIQKWNPLECRRITDEYALVFKLNATDPHSAQDIEEVLVKVGYERNKIHIKETIENE
jgi:hypothetical protein